MTRSGKKAVEIYTLLGDQGDLESQRHLARIYSEFDYAEDVETDFVQSFKWFKLAAEQGDPESQYELAMMYYDGDHVAQSFEDAYKWFDMSAESGFDYSYYWLGRMYEFGEYVEQDFDVAAEYYEKAAEHHDNHAMGRLGALYFMDRCRCGTPAKAFELLKKGSTFDTQRSRYYLGLAYLLGKGTPQSFDDALEWFLKSALAEYSFAAFALGLLYKYGLGLEKSPKDAEYWLLRAYDGGLSLPGKILHQMAAEEEINKNHLSTQLNCDSSKGSIEAQYYLRDTIENLATDDHPLRNNNHNHDFGSKDLNIAVSNLKKHGAISDDYLDGVSIHWSLISQEYLGHADAENSAITINEILSHREFPYSYLELIIYIQFLKLKGFDFFSEDVNLKEITELRCRFPDYNKVSHEIYCYFNSTEEFF